MAKRVSTIGPLYIFWDLIFTADNVAFGLHVKLPVTIIYTVQTFRTISRDFRDAIGQGFNIQKKDVA